jgi:type I restriction enzyme, S subunit
MEGNWHSGKLSDLTEILMGQSPSGETCNSQHLGIPLLNGPTEFSSHHPIPVQFTIDPKKIAELDDILFCVRGSTTGRMNWSDQKYAIGRGIAAIRHKQGSEYKHFIRGLLELKLPLLLTIATGSTFPNISKDQLLSLPCDIPPLSEQKAIAHILGTLDDKIELNQQMNETLEAMARAIFKSWFVDFDPVRAKMEGRQPAGMDAATADLFPDKFEESSLGLIPKGWLYKPAETICSIGIGKTPPRKESEWFSNSYHDIRWASIRDMGGSGTFISDTKEYLVSEAITRFNVRVVPDHTVLLSFKLTIGRVAITDGEMTTNEAIAHFKLDNKIDISSEYLYLYLKAFDYNQLGSTSSIAEATNSKIIKAMPILIPDSELMKKFTNQVANIFARIKSNQKESYTLTTIRDTLLPKLMSGEIRVKEAEKIINNKLS